MKVPWKKIVWVAVPMLIAGGAFYWWYKSQGPKKTFVSKSPATTPPKVVTPAAANPSSGFPLKQGSSNDYVKKLQAALGVTADGIFGPQTAGALQSQFNMSSVADEDTLNNIILSNSPQVVASKTQAMAWLSQFRQGSFDIAMQSDYFSTEYTEDASGVLNPTGSGFQMKNGQTYDGTVYTLDGLADPGLLIMKVVAGPLQGEYTLDPNVIQLTPHSDALYTVPTVGVPGLPIFQ